MKFSALSAAALGLLAPLLANAAPVVDRHDNNNNNNNNNDHVSLRRGAGGSSSSSSRSSSDNDLISGHYIVQLKPGVSPDQINAHHHKVRRMVVGGGGSSSSSSSSSSSYPTSTGTGSEYPTASGLSDALEQVADNLDDVHNITSVDDLQDTVEDILQPLADYVKRTFSFGQWAAYQAEFDPATAEKIGCLDEVELVEPDRPLRLFDVQTQSGANWNLGSVSHRGTNSTDYVRDASLGEGTWAYVVDTGVRATHQELAGRVTMGYNAIAGSEDGDTVGHGTHVAGTVAGATLGVAGKAGIVDVKVFGSESGSTSDGLDGFQWAVNDIISKGRQNSAIINLSLGASDSTAWDNAVIHAYDQGILTACAAGNGGGDVQSYSPGRTTQCLTVGNVMEDLTRHPTSNYGPAVDVFAPGTHIVSASYESDTGTLSKSGTSMATPMIAGLVCYLRGLEGAMGPEPVVNRIVDLSTKNIVKDPQDCPNRLAFNGVSS